MLAHDDDASPTQLEIAFHEGAHAVVSIVYGIPVGYVTVTPESGSLGHVWNGRMSHTKVARLLVMMAAGGAATRKLSSHSRGSRKDREYIATCLRLVSGVEADRLARRLRRWEHVADRVVCLHWAWIARVAVDLLLYKFLTGGQVAELRACPSQQR